MKPIYLHILTTRKVDMQYDIAGLLIICIAMNESFIEIEYNRLPIRSLLEEDSFALKIEGFLVQCKFYSLKINPIMMIPIQPNECDPLPHRWMSITPWTEMQRWCLICSKGTVPTSVIVSNLSFIVIDCQTLMPRLEEISRNVSASLEIFLSKISECERV